MTEGTKEKRFLTELEALFTGAEVEGDSGFVNLMQMKRRYFQSLRPQLMAEIDQRAEKQTSFREELFDKLYTFFQRYFCESGSIYFRHLPAFAKTYERVYEDGQDVALSWKTQMLYYVKSDVLVRSITVELNEEGAPQKTRRFYFDASKFEGKQNNEKREFVFSFAQVKEEKQGQVVHLNVAYSQRGNRTNTGDIVKQAGKDGAALTEEQLQKAIGVFRRQTEADFFINKDAKGFLREQFDLWMYQYIFSEQTIFEEKRIKQLQAIKETAYFIIDFIAQFEDELRRVWEKPKFVRKVNYVVTLDKLTDETLQKIITHKGVKAQIKEWQALGMVDDAFSMQSLFNGQGNLYRENGMGDDYKYLPLDTKHFKDLELEILDDLGNLDEALDGELVHSENWQALNTLKARYQGKVKCIYIDPPYNTDASAILYTNSYKDSSWLSLMENRLSLSKQFLWKNGILCCAIDDEEFLLLKQITDSLFTKNLGIATVRSNPAGRKTKGKLSPSHEYAMFIGESENSILGSLPKTKKSLDRYPERDEQGQFAWASFVRSGSGDRREDRPKLHYPIFVNSKNKIRIPKMEWDTDTGEYNLQEQPRDDETVVYPFREIDDKLIEGRWHRGYQRVIDEPEEFRASRSSENRVSIHFKTRMDLHSMPTTWWSENEYASSNYGTGELKKLFSYGDFDFAKAPRLVQDCLITAGANENNINILDYFAGSGTTAHAVINLNREDGGRRKYLLIEMGEYFHTVLLPRIKKVVYSKDWREGKPVSREGSSHFLKYYTLEQYEETLKNSHYADGDQLELDSTKSPFEQYVFFGDDKLAQAVKLQKNGKLKINLHHLYKDIDIAESLVNILGKTIRKRTAERVTFADGSSEKTNPSTMTEQEKQHFISLIKPYLWWGE